MTNTQGPTIIAIGGNAISPPGQEGNINQQFDATRTSAMRLADLIVPGHKIVITHGNGPQVGNVIRRVEIAASEVYPLPLDICVADTQGGMGYMITQCINNELRRRNVSQRVATVVTTVEVDKSDPAFDDPTKPIGDFYEEDRALQMQRDQGWVMKKLHHGYRRVVPSPLPQRVMQIDLIRKLLEHGTDVVIAGGGGGIPVIRDAEGMHVGCEAVIDKDRTAALIAIELNAASFFVITSVPQVAINFGQDNEKSLSTMTIADAKQHLADGQFPPGSMGPKIRAAIEFLEKSQREDPVVIITDMDQMKDAWEGRGGTRITR